MKQGKPASRRAKGVGPAMGPVPLLQPGRSGSLPAWPGEKGSPEATSDPRDSAQARPRHRAPKTPGPSQAGPHRVAAETHRYPRGERPAEQPPCCQHRVGPAGSPQAVTFTALRLRNWRDRNARWRTGKTSRPRRRRRALASLHPFRFARGPASLWEGGEANALAPGLLGDVVPPA